MNIIGRAGSYPPYSSSVASHPDPALLSTDYLCFHGIVNCPRCGGKP